jgi:hypothetical protein
VTAATVAGRDSQYFAAPGAAPATFAVDLTTIGTIASGDLLLIYASSHDSGTWQNTPSGWTEVNNYSAATNGMRSALYGRQAAGGETSVTLEYSADESACFNIARITGAELLATQAPGIVNSFFNGANPDPTGISGLSSNDYLYLAFVGKRGSLFTAAPTGYSNFDEANGSLQSCGMADLGTTATTGDDPGTWTTAGTQNNCMAVVAVYPSTAVAGAISIAPILQNYLHMGLMQ